MGLQQLIRCAYIICFFAWSILTVLSGDLVAGRPPVWTFSGGVFLSYVTALLLFCCGLSMALKRYASFTLILSGIIILIYATSRNLYQLVIDGDIGISLTNTNKGLSIVFGSFLMAHILNPESAKGTARLTPIVLGLFLFCSGVQHFIYAGFVDFLVPGWLPFTRFWTYSAGVALIVSGIALMIGFKRPIAAAFAGGMIFLWLLILHIPRALSHASINEWTAVFEALYFSAALFLIYTFYKKMPIRDHLN